METIGEYLKLKRQESGLTVESLSNTTKIRPEFIKEIEGDDFSSFSSPQLIRGYVKLIIKYVKGDLEYAFSLLEPQIDESFKNKTVEDFVGNRLKKERQRVVLLRKRIILSILAGLSVLLLIFISVKAYKLFSTISIPEISLFSSSGNKNIAVKKSDAVIKKNESYSTGVVKSTNTKHYALTLTAKIVERTWVAVSIDGNPKKTYMMHSGDTKTWKAKKHLYIKIGNAAGVKLNYNGKHLKKIGGEKDVAVLNFPRA